MEEYPDELSSAGTDSLDDPFDNIDDDILDHTSNIEATQQ